MQLPCTCHCCLRACLSAQAGFFLANGAETLAAHPFTCRHYESHGQARIPCAIVLPRVALCEVALLEVVLRHLIHVAPGALRDVLPRHLDVDLKTMQRTQKTSPASIFMWWHRYTYNPSTHGIYAFTAALFKCWGIAQVTYALDLHKNNNNIWHEENNINIIDNNSSRTHTRGWSPPLCLTHPPGVRAHALVDVEECPELGADVFHSAGLVAAVGLDGVAVHGVAHPQHLQAQHIGRRKEGRKKEREEERKGGRKRGMG